MDDKIENPAAFPHPPVVKTDNRPHEVVAPGEMGMSLLDYFAAAALPGLANNWINDPAAEDGDIDLLYTLKELASDAYRIADFMLAERNRRLYASDANTDKGEDYGQPKH